MDINKYKNNGWGLSKKTLECLLKNIDWKKDLTIVEFGSGISTQFLLDCSTKNSKVYSFDDNKNYAYAKKNKKLTLNILPLVYCNEQHFKDIFKNAKYDRKFFKKQTAVHSRQPNTFYDIESSHIPNNIDLVILDGPHGNGRSISFIHLKDKIKKGGTHINRRYQPL